MPGPFAILGAGFFGSMFGNLFSSAVEFLTKKIGKKLAIRAVFMTSLLAMLLVFVGICQAIILGLSLTMPPEYTNILVNVLPDNTSFCLSSVITVNISRRLYDLKVKTAANTWLGI